MGRVAWTRGEGPLVPFVAGYRQELLRRGHTPGSVKCYLVLRGQLSRWLSGEGPGVGELTQARAEEFLLARRARRRRRGHRSLARARRRSFHPALLHAGLSIKERALARTTFASSNPGRYQPPDSLLAFLESL